MSKRSFLFGTLVLVAGLVSAAPSHAGTVFVTSVDFASSSPALTEIDIIFAPSTGTLSALSAATPASVTATLIGTNEVALTFAASTGPINPIVFSATASAGAFADIKVASVNAVYVNNQTGTSTIGYSLSNPAVPEPASFALLGIGMTGFLAFRRFFKKTAVD